MVAAVSRLRAQLIFGPGIVNWGCWLLMTFLVCSQFLGLVWDTTSSLGSSLIGRSPLNPPTTIPGFNDEPYADRAIVCLVEGRTYVPTQLSAVLADTKLATVTDTTGTSINGFRVVKRDAMKLQPQIADIYTRVCDRIDYTLTAIQDSCDSLGFNVTRDTLRIVDSVTSNTTREIQKALPIVLVPFWDNAVHMYYVIPGWQGSACVFRLNGIYQSPTISWGVLRAVPQANRESKTVEWLNKLGGSWRNGWYEDMNGQKWFSNMMTSNNGGPYGIIVRQFDTLANTELDCDSPRALGQCKPALVIEKWGRLLTTTTEITQQDQVFATNGSRFGLFMFQATSSVTVKNVYSLETFISNMSVFVVLIRWFVSLAAMMYTYCQGVEKWQTTSVGSLSSSRTFNAMPVVLLPRLKTTLCAFFTAGCSFEGQQMALSNAWYIIYPGIVEFMFFYYSLLNITAKFTYRRVSDVLFIPTVLTLCALHYFRGQIALHQWFGINSRVSTLILSDEVDALRLPDFLTTNAALRMNGNVKPLFYFKLGLMALNLVPLLLAENMTEKGKKFRAFATCDIEQLLALRASNLGGLGRSEVYAFKTPVRSPSRGSSSPVRPDEVLAPSKADLFKSRAIIEPFSATSQTEKPTKERVSVGPRHALIGYEMSRLGYLVFGGRYLLSFDDWYILTSMAPLRVVEKLWNYRIIVFDVERNDNGSYRVTGTAHLCRLDDPQLRIIPFYRVTVCAFQ